jgi:hypothetical protein
LEMLNMVERQTVERQQVLAASEARH